MHKGKLKNIILILALGISVLLGYQIVKKFQEKQKLVQSIETIPNFSFKTLDDSLFTKEHLHDGLPTVFLYFNSECEFCQHEARNISENIHLLKDIQLVFVSTEPIEKIKEFSEQNSLEKIKNVNFLHDGYHNFSILFQPSSIPFNLIYDKDQKLLKIQKGQLSVHGILKIIKQK